MRYGCGMSQMYSLPHQHPRLVDELHRLMAVWGLNTSELARLFGISRQAAAKWLVLGPPNHRAPAIADLAAMTDVLEHYLKSERIPAVVRRPAPAMADRSLVELIEQGDARAALDAVRAMFQFTDLHS